MSSRAKPLAPVRVMASLLVLAAAVLPAREVASPQAAPMTTPCGPEFRSELATILKLRDPGEAPVLGSSAEEELRLSLALVINDYLMVAPKAQSEGRLPRSLRGLDPKQLRQWRDTGKVVPAVCEIVGFMHAHYSGVPYTPKYAELPPTPEPRPAPSARASAKLAIPSAVAKPQAKPAPPAEPPAEPAPVVTPSRDSAPSGGAAPATRVEPQPAAQAEPKPSLEVPIATATPKEPSLLRPDLGPMAVRTAAQLEQLLSVPPYPTLRDLRVQNLELTRKELGARRRTALRARAELLALLQELRASEPHWNAVRERFGSAGAVRVEQGIERTFSGSAAAEEREEALRLWRGEP